MSAKQVTQAQITCDGCGAVYPLLDSPVARVRKLAAVEGWKHRQIKYATSGWFRQIDLCATCEEPAA